MCSIHLVYIQCIASHSRSIKAVQGSTQLSSRHLSCQTVSPATHQSRDLSRLEKARQGHKRQ